MLKVQNEIIKNVECGFASERAHEQLSDIIKQIAENKKKIADMRENLYGFHRENYKKELLVNRIESILINICAKEEK